MAEVFLQLLNMSITASWLILAVVVLRLLLKKTPKWIICMMWCLVGIRLLIPVSIESVFSLIPSAEVVSEDILYDRSPAINSGIDSVNRVVNPILQENFTPDAGDSVNPLQAATYIAAHLWMLGMAVLLAYTLITYVRLKKRVSDAVRLNGNIYQSEKVGSPFVLGTVKPHIYVPYGLSEEELSCVIAHEQAHIKRGDHLLKPIAFLVLTIYWFNPLVWMAYTLLCRDIEFACDEKVLQQLGKEKKKIYSEALLRCSISGNVSHRMIAACPIAFGEVGVKNRIRGVLNYKKPAFWIVIVGIVACVVCIVCFMTNPKKDTGSGNPSNPQVSEPASGQAASEAMQAEIEDAQENLESLQTNLETAQEDLEAQMNEMSEVKQNVEDAQKQILQSPPSMLLHDALTSNMEYFEVTAGTYSWNYPSEEEPDRMITKEASGNEPTVAVKGAEWLQLKEYNRLDYAVYTVYFEVMPDSVTVKEYDLLELGNVTDPKVLSESTYEEVFALELKPRRIYEVAAQWNEENLGENGFFGTAYYIYATDNYMVEAEGMTVDELILGEKFTEEVNNLNGVSMHMYKYKATEGDVELYNDTNQEYQFGEYYDIQVQKDGQWYSLQTKNEIAFEAVAIGLKEGSSCTWDVNWEYAYGALPEGKYRIVKDIMDYRAPGDYTKYYLAAEFEIMPSY